MQPRHVQILSTGWQFKQTDTESWLPVSRVPTNVHLDLLAANKIPDPYIDDNEHACAWIADQSWTYRVTLPSILINGGRTILAMDGLDTYATVRLDGENILESDNMWHIHRLDVTSCLAAAGTHILEITFRSARLEAQAVKARYSEHKWLGFNGDTARLAARKAQYHWGWDWGPVLTTCGPWREVRLETYAVRIADVKVDYTVADGLGSVAGCIFVEVESEEPVSVNVRVVLEREEAVLDEWIVVPAGKQGRLDFLITEPRFWYPRGYGAQDMYRVTAVVQMDGAKLDECSRMVAFRKAELVQQPDQLGRSFFFRVNDIDVFCGGVNWIPADCFIPRIDNERYRRWLQMAADGSHIMVRVWGGGIWEEDIFYETCDELGLLVWQDFMFACGNYPAFPAFLKSIEREGADQLSRLRHHPSIVLYAGNNEDYQVQEQLGLTYDAKDKDPSSWLQTDFPARYIYEHLLPSLVSRFVPHVPYAPGSPFTPGGQPSTSPTAGDLHQWNVWHGTQEKYQLYPRLGGRFVSEFGMEALPHLATLEGCITDPAQLYPESRMMAWHNKAAGHERRLAVYIAENFRARSDLRGYVHLTQMLQSEALGYAYRGWRRRWQDRQCGGALVWQLNDTWPGTSWAIVDYWGRKKAAWYTIRRALAGLAVGVMRKVVDWTGEQVQPPGKVGWECWVASSLMKDVEGTVEVSFFAVKDGTEVKEPLKRDVVITANGTTEVLSGIVDRAVEEPHVVSARLFVNGECVARDTDFPQPLKYDDYSIEAAQRTDMITQSAGQIRVSVPKPVKCLMFEERDGVTLSDNAIDVVPGDDRVIEVKGMKEGEKPLEWMFYSM